MKIPCNKLLQAVLIIAVFGRVLLCHADNAGQIFIARTNSNLLVSWTNVNTALETALALPGAWNEITGAVSPRVIYPTNLVGFYRLRAVTNGFDYLYSAPSFTVSIGLAGSSCGCVSPENPNSLSSGAVSAQDSGLGNVFLHTGELIQHAVDLVIPGRGFDWRFERSYRSGMNYNGPLGNGWEFNYNRRLSIETSGDVKRMDGMGRSDRYLFLSGTNYQAPSGQFTRLFKNANGSFTENDPHGTKWIYAAASSSSICKLTNMTDRVGNQMTFRYNSQGQLTNVIDSLSRSITYRYDGAGHLTNVLDFIGRNLNFGYDANGNLVTVTSPAVTGTPNGNDFPNGKTTRYTYSSGLILGKQNLLTVTAPNEVASGGPPFLVAQYISDLTDTNLGRLQTLTLGATNSSGAIVYQYKSLVSFAAPGDSTTAVFQNTVTNRNGNVTEYRFNQFGNPVRKVTRTSGLRLGEPAGYTNTMAYNGDGLIIYRTNGELDSISFTYNSASGDRLQQGNLLQTRWLPGPRSADQVQLVTSSTYNTNFNFVATATDARSNTMTYSYDSKGNVTTIIHRLSSIVESFAYNSSGQVTNHSLPDNGNGSGYRRRDGYLYYSSGPQKGYLQSQTIDAGSTNFNLTTTYEYDAVGNNIRTVAPAGGDTLYVYNSLNEVVRQSSRQVSTPSGLVRYNTDTFYDANGNVVQTDVENRDSSGLIVSNNAAFTTTHIFDILNRETSTAQEVAPGTNIVMGYSYDANGHVVLTRSGEAMAGRQTNNVIQAIYDERDLLFLTIRAPGDASQSTDQFDYDANGNLTRQSQGIESSPRILTTAFDGYNRQITQTDAMGNVSTQHYDANGNTTSQRTDGELIDVPGGTSNVRLAEKTFTFDAEDRLTATDQAFFDAATGTNILGGHAVSQTIYANAGLTLQTIDANSHTNSVTYDTGNRRKTVTDAKGNTTTYAYDSDGNITLTTEVDRSDLGSPDQTFLAQSTYDGLDRLVQKIDNIGNTSSFAYDSRGNRQVMTDGRGNGTSYAFDGLNRLTSTTHLLTDNGFGSGTVTGAVVTLQSWDDNSRLTGQIDANTNTTAYIYDALNRMTCTVFADGTTNQSNFDVHNNRIGSADANGNIVVSTYDLLNRETGRVITRGAAVVGTTFENYQFDGLSRTVQAENDDSTVTRSYDSLSSVTHETQQVVSSGSPARSVDMAYDAMGNPLTCTYPGGRIVTNTYDSLNQKLAVSDSLGMIASYNYYGPGRVERRDYGNGTRVVYSYDGIRRLTNSFQGVIIGGTPIDSRAYAWDAANNKTAMTDLLSPALESKAFTYDSINRLVQSETAFTGPTNIYSLDGVGNRISVMGGTNAGNYFMDATVPPADFQMNQYTSTPFDTRTNDANGNLMNAGAQQFAYDYRNRLIAAYSFDGISAYTNVLAAKYDCLGRRIEKSSSTNTNRYYYYGWQECEEQDGVDATAATYVWGNGIDDALNMNRGGQNYFYHADDLGSVRKITDNLGNLLEQYRYDDYGKPSFFDGSGATLTGTLIGNATLFTGRRYDSETGLCYYRTRYLDPAAGRFTTRDTIGIWGDTGNLGNGFGYVGNNPVTWQDPSGQMWDFRVDSDKIIYLQCCYRFVGGYGCARVTVDPQNVQRAVDTCHALGGLPTPDPGAASVVRNQQAFAAAGDGIGGVDIGLKKKTGGSIYATLKFTGLPHVPVLPASWASVAAAGDGISGVDIGLKKCFRDSHGVRYSKGSNY